MKLLPVTRLWPFFRVLYPVYRNCGSEKGAIWLSQPLYGSWPIHYHLRIGSKSSVMLIYTKMAKVESKLDSFVFHMKGYLYHRFIIFGHR